MRMCTVISIVGLLSAMTCSKKDKLSQCNIYQTNIDINHELFTHQLSDERNHYLFGVLEEDKRDFRTKEITIERAKVGDEIAWTSFSETIPGISQAVGQTKTSVFIISRQQYEERQDPKYSRHKLYKISKQDGTIVELYEWDKGNSFVKDIFFESDKRGFVFFRPSGNPLDYQIFETINGGKEWNIIDIKKPVLATQSKGNLLYFLSYKRNTKANLIYSLNKKSNDLDSLQFNLNITDFTVEKNDDYWLLGKYGDKTILQRYQDGKDTDIKTFSEDPEFSPGQLYKYNDVIVVIASQVNKSMLGGFGGTQPEMYLSKDNGLTWTNQTVDEALYIKPTSFYKNERMTAYIGAGRVLICKFTN